MLRRCHNPKHKNFKDYGGRGITICDRWLNSYEAFLEDMGEKPKGLSLERENNNGNYEPGNCKWATRTEQNNNKRNNIKIVLDKTPISLKQAADLLSISYHKMRYLYHIKNLSVDQILSEVNK